METGGGPASSIHLNDVKERALNLLGRVVVDGHNIGRVGRGVCAPVVTFAETNVEVLDDSDGVVAVDDGFAEHAIPITPSSATPQAATRKRNAETKTPSRRAAKVRQMEAIQENDNKVAEAISRLADRIGDLAENKARNQSLFERLIENQERMMAMLLEKYL